MLCVCIPACQQAVDTDGLMFRQSGRVCVLHPYHFLQLKPWKLEEGDHTLLDLMPFLEAIYRANVPDIRDVVEFYEGKDIPTAFRYNAFCGVFNSSFC